MSTVNDEYTKYCDKKIAGGATVHQIMSRQDWYYCWNLAVKSTRSKTKQQGDSND